MALIECRKLTRSFQKGGSLITPLKELDLDVEAGSFVALMGPSGSGKTTLLNLIAGIDRPTSGSLKIDGRELMEMSRSQLAGWRSEYIGYIFQLYNLVPVLTAYENVELPLLLHSYTKSQRHEKVALALEVVGLADRHDHFPRQLSGGQMQRVAIARALVNDPTILLADEPTGNLDSKTGELVLATFQKLHDRGHTVILITHEPDVAEHAERIIVIKDGLITSDQKNPHPKHTI